MDIWFIKKRNLAKYLIYLGNIFLCLVIGFSIFACLYNYQSQSYTYDEVYTINLAQQPIAKIIYGDPGNPPLHFLAYKIWITLFSDSEASTRALSIIIFIGCITTTWRLVKRLTSSTFLALLAAMLFSFSYTHIWESREARYYMFAVLFTTLSIDYYIQYVTKKNKWQELVIINTLGIFTHFAFIFLIIAQLITYIHLRIKFKSLMFPELRVFIIPILLIFVYFLPRLNVAQNFNQHPTIEKVSAFINYDLWFYTRPPMNIFTFTENYLNWSSSNYYIYSYIILFTYLVLFSLLKIKSTKQQAITILLLISASLTIIPPFNKILPLPYMQYLFFFTPQISIFTASLIDQSHIY